MSLSQESISILTRRLPQDKIKSRPGKAGMSFSYISPDYVIEVLNEAFVHDWDTKIVYSELHENTAVVGLELSVRDGDGNRVCKQQFGSCDVTRGLGVGEAFKGAASDAMKKCATLLGLGLELYQADEPVGGPAPAAKFVPPQAAQRPPAPPANPAGGPPAPPQRAESAPRSPVPPAKPATPPAPRGPGAPVTRAVGTNTEAAAPAPRTAAVVPPKPKHNPFANPGAAQAEAPSTTQMNSLKNIAEKRGLSPAEMISNAGIVDEFGNPLRTFEELSYSQAIQVVQAAQR